MRNEHASPLSARNGPRYGRSFTVSPAEFLLFNPYPANELVHVYVASLGRERMLKRSLNLKNISVTGTKNPEKSYFYDVHKPISKLLRDIMDTLIRKWSQHNKGCTGMSKIRLIGRNYQGLLTN